MAQNKLKWPFVFLLFSIGGFTQAQDALPAAGGNASGSGGSASYTVGQVAYSYSSNGGSVTQGVQQSYVITTVLGMDDAIRLYVAVYPNPTTDYLTLSVQDNSLNKELTFMLYDMQGKLLLNKGIDVVNTTIEMADMRSATYYLKVVGKESTVKTFKIIKN